MIVNAANCELQLGGGVAGAISGRGGPSIQAECDAHGPIAVGEAALTGAGDLPARWVIHAASMSLGGRATVDSVRSAWRATLALADAKACSSLATPAIGSGIAGLGTQACAEVMLDEARSHLAAGSGLAEIRIVLYGEPDFRVFEMVNDAAKVAAQMERLHSR